VALLELPNKTTSASAAAAAASAAGDRKRRADGSVSDRASDDEPPAPQAVTEPATGTSMPAALTDISKESESSDKRVRRSQSTASRGGTGSAEQHKAACTGSPSGQGRAASDAAAAADARGRQGAEGSSSISGAHHEWLGKLHVCFVQLSQKAPPRLAAPSGKARGV
jgi:hypothetical protein